MCTRDSCLCDSLRCNWKTQNSVFQWYKVTETTHTTAVALQLSLAQTGKIKVDSEQQKEFHSFMQSKRRAKSGRRSKKVLTHSSSSVNVSRLLSKNALEMLFLYVNSGCTKDSITPAGRKSSIYWGKNRAQNREAGSTYIWVYPASVITPGRRETK